jgi:hypothetical protein
VRDLVVRAEHRGRSAQPVVFDRLAVGAATVVARRVAVVADLAHLTERAVAAHRVRQTRAETAREAQRAELGGVAVRVRRTVVGVAVVVVFVHETRLQAHVRSGRIVTEAEPVEALFTPRARRGELRPRATSLTERSFLTERRLQAMAQRVAGRALGTRRISREVAALRDAAADADAVVRAARDGVLHLARVADRRRARGEAVAVAFRETVLHAGPTVGAGAGGERLTRGVAGAEPAARTLVDAESVALTGLIDVALTLVHAAQRARVADLEQLVAAVVQILAGFARRGPRVEGRARDVEALALDEGKRRIVGVDRRELHPGDVSRHGGVLQPFVERIVHLFEGELTAPLEVPRTWLEYRQAKRVEPLRHVRHEDHAVLARIDRVVRWLRQVELTRLERRQKIITRRSSAVVELDEHVLRQLGVAEHVLHRVAQSRHLAERVEVNEGTAKRQRRAARLPTRTALTGVTTRSRVGAPRSGVARASFARRTAFADRTVLTGVTAFARRAARARRARRPRRITVGAGGGGKHSR